MAVTEDLVVCYAIYFEGCLQMFQVNVLPDSLQLQVTLSSDKPLCSSSRYSERARAGKVSR
jgi:hypothetical protein